MSRVVGESMSTSEIYMIAICAVINYLFGSMYACTHAHMPLHPPRHRHNLGHISDFILMIFFESLCHFVPQFENCGRIFRLEL